MKQLEMRFTVRPSRQGDGVVVIAHSETGKTEAKQAFTTTTVDYPTPDAPAGMAANHFATTLIEALVNSAAQEYNSEAKAAVPGDFLHISGTRDVFEGVVALLAQAGRARANVRQVERLVAESEEYLPSNHWRSLHRTERLLASVEAIVGPLARALDHAKQGHEFELDMAQLDTARRAAQEARKSAFIALSAHQPAEKPHDP